MRVVIARTMPEFSMDVYAEGLISALWLVRPDWEIIELSPYLTRSIAAVIQQWYESISITSDFGTFRAASERKLLILWMPQKLTW